MTTTANLAHVFGNQKVTIKTKCRIFNFHVSSVFVYNSELWILTKSSEIEIDALHHRLIKLSV